MKVVWTATAQDHLDSIYTYIAQDSPQYALRMVDRLTRRSQQIADAPFSGRRVPEYDLDQIREIIEGVYRYQTRSGRCSCCHSWCSKYFDARQGWRLTLPAPA